MMDSRPPSSVVNSKPYPSAVHAMSFSRAAVAVTRRADARPSSGRTHTSPNATIAIVLPSGLSAASVVAVARFRSSAPSPMSSDAVNFSATGFAPGVSSARL